jgi:hypothetical protein
MNSEENARCQPFWFFIAAALAIICIVVLVGVIVRILLDKREGTALPGDERYKKPS